MPFKARPPTEPPIAGRWYVVHHVAHGDILTQYPMSHGEACTFKRAMTKPSDWILVDVTPASWVIKRRGTGDVITELWDVNLVESLNTEKYEAVPIREHLASLNAPEEPTPCLTSPK